MAIPKEHQDFYENLFPFLKERKDFCDWTILEDHTFSTPLALTSEMSSHQTGDELLNAINLRLDQYSMCDSTGEIDSWECVMFSLDNGLEVSFYPKESTSFFKQEICKVKRLTFFSSN